MRKVIVTTTINPPTEAIRKFDSMEEWDLVVVGDLKTPMDYKLARGTYYNPADQESFDKPLSDAIGWNCIQRRNLGLLIAYEMGADVVAVVDDDNIPLDGWGKDLLVGREVEVNYFKAGLPVFDPVGATNHSELWHRGFPLPLVSQRDYSQKMRNTIHVDVQADFWNGDPDIDAICRMEHSPECAFDPRCFPIAADAPAPFNSQNTFLGRSVLEHYFLYPFIGRMDDIWASYYIQTQGFRVAFAEPSVFQKRNEHDLIIDMKKEFIGYEHNLRLVEDLRDDPESILSYLPGRAVWAWELYRRHFSHA